jgi:hypothetical protein
LKTINGSINANRIIIEQVLCGSGATTSEVFSPSSTVELFGRCNSDRDENDHDSNSSGKSSSYATKADQCALEVLASSLVSKDYFEEAYCCIHKVSLLKDIDRYNAEKKDAVENDDLERAMAIKQKLVTTRLALTALENEKYWTEFSLSKRNGESLRDLVELVQAIDPEKGVKCLQFLDPYRKPSSKGTREVNSLQEKVYSALLMKRSLRMATAVCTTHTKYPHYWLLLLDHVSSVLQNASNIVEAFKRLNVTDKQVVASTKKMKSFLEGNMIMAELALWVCASCIEALVHEVR